ncbi:E2 family protein B [Pseudomonas sp. NFACC23-1]|uniref:ThiF family adenylyltransferase n=1 Tax=unclassified Pseudomonas TaxID=196821 RepID=UPI000888A777|nr:MULTISPECIES: ThiF family adenylyltransferase [unclassified Pseudomonas]SDB28876.1 E2 family protein B [Pseudomonas sp. NFACC17-2]SEJ42379.1 E2 family protein B [Pseudomonas sp. NFACC23-1]SFW67281.1 E2 family protein B [Pseudomonas sp. NFACC16-2]
MDFEGLGDVLRYMHGLGFKARPTKNGVRRFLGILKSTAGPVPIELAIADWDFLVYPTIRITEKPSFLPIRMAHGVVGGDFCYLAEGSVVLDRYNPTGAIAFCLQQATSLIDQLISNPTQSQTDMQAEFQSYWAGSSLGTLLPIGLSELSSELDEAKAYKLSPKGPFGDIITTSKEALDRVALSWGASAQLLEAQSCWLLRTTAAPDMSSALPWTVKETLAWLKTWDRSLYAALQKRIEADTSILDLSRIYILIDSPAGWIGFGFSVNKRYLTKATTKGAAGSRKFAGKAYFQYLHRFGGSDKIFRLLTTNLSSDFVHTRNLSGSLKNGLSGLKIALLGCGSVGGYVAQALTRLGAGTDGGQLTLIDNQFLQPENIGRHALGFNALLKRKSNALKDELDLQFPYSNIESRPIAITPKLDYSSFDLIINATGEEPLSEMLNALRISNEGTFPPILHAWIKGNGECVQALWTDSLKHGCFRCLRRHEPGSEMAERFKVLKNEVEKGFRACQHFTPYAVSASLSAAALVADMLIDWKKNGSPSPRFRTRAVENADTFKIKNQDITPLSGCPACGTK